MLETISESRELKAALPPRPQFRKVFEGAEIKTARDYGDDQDPSHGDDEEYAKYYTASQARKAALAQKDEESSPKSSSPGSDTSERCKAFVFNMSAAQEPLYGDPGEEDYWK